MDIVPEKHRQKSKIKNLVKIKKVSLAATMILGIFAVSISAGQLPAIQSFSASPDTVILGSSLTLNWSTTDVVSVYIDQGIGVVPPNGTISVKPLATTKYTMVAINGNNSTSASIGIEVIYVKPTVNYFYADPDEIGMGMPTNLSWNVTGATMGVTLDPDGSTVSMLGNLTVYPVGGAQYMLNATNESGSTIMAVTIGCINPSVSLTGSPLRILYGDSATLEWNTSEASRTSFNHEIGSVAANGTITVSPEERSTYTLSAYNPCGELATNSTTIDVYHAMYDFITNGEHASWSGSKGKINYGGGRDDSDGSATLVYDSLIGDLTTGFRLWTHPTWVSNGYIEGVYDLTDFVIEGRKYTPEQRDHISGEYGLFPSADSVLCGEVIFKIILRSEGIPDFNVVGPTKLNCENTRNAFDVYIPPEFIGKPIKVVLRVEAGASSFMDHAGWKGITLLRG
jgi:hypothetical protein